MINADSIGLTECRNVIVSNLSVRIMSNLVLHCQSPFVTEFFRHS